MVTAYLLLSLWFLVVDLAASRIVAGRVPPPALSTLGLAFAWPVAMAFAVVGQALIIRRLTADRSVRGAAGRRRPGP